MKSTHVIHIRLNHNEYQKLWKIADKKAAKLSQMVRSILREFMTEQPEIDAKILDDFRSTLRQITGISRNINQTVKAIHQGKYPAEKDLKQQLGEMAQQLENHQNLLRNMVRNTQQRNVKIMDKYWSEYGRK